MKDIRRSISKVKKKLDGIIDSKTIWSSSISTTIFIDDAKYKIYNYNKKLFGLADCSNINDVEVIYRKDLDKIIDHIIKLEKSKILQ